MAFLKLSVNVSNIYVLPCYLELRDFTLDALKRVKKSITILYKVTLIGLQDKEEYYINNYNTLACIILKNSKVAG